MTFIIQWNINGLKTQFEKLQIIISKYSPNIICLQETNFKENYYRPIKGYNCYYSNRVSERASGGVATYVKDTLITKNIRLQTNLEVVSVDVYYNDMNLHIINLYLPSNKLCFSTEIQNILNITSTPKILVGDLNAHNPSWGSSKTDKRGILIENIIDDNNFVILNNGAGTRLNPNSGEFSAIDVSVCDPQLSHKLTWESLDYSYGSDHLPLKIDFLDKSKNENVHFLNKWNLKTADWSSYALYIDENLDSITYCEDIDSQVNTFTSLLINAANTFVKKISLRVGKTNCPWWNDKCKEAIKQSKTAFNKMKRQPNQDNLINYKRLRAKARYAVKTSNKQSWKSHVSSITSETKPSELWTKIKRIKGISSSHKMSNIELNGQVIY